MDGCEIHFAPRNESVIEIIIWWYLHRNHQGFLGGAGFCPSTVVWKRWLSEGSRDLLEYLAERRHVWRSKARKRIGRLDQFAQLGFGEICRPGFPCVFLVRLLKTGWWRKQR